MNNIADLQGFLIDLDGTLYLGNQVIPGAADFITTLRENDKRFLILSNNSSKSRKSYQEKLRQLKIEVELTEILTSTIASADFIITNFPRAKVYPVGTPDFEAELISLGIDIDYSNADTVLLGFDTTLTYEKLRIATKFIFEGARFIATHGDVLCPTENGFIPDIGTFIPLFERATGVSPLIIGKPNKSMIDSALGRLQIPVNNVGMIGDRLYTDMKMANTFGLASILVLSGETTADELIFVEPKPDFVFRSVREMIPIIV